jgi:signal transduction histidine kinase
MGALLRRMFGPYARRGVWLESAFLVLDLPVGIALFTIVITLLSLSAGLAVTLVGLPLLAATVVGGRAVATVEGVRTRVLLDEQLVPHPPAVRPAGLWPRAKAMMADRAGWKGLLYSLLMLPWGIFTFTSVVVLWSVAFTMATVPLWGWAVDPPPPFTVGTNRYDIDGWSLFGWSVLAGVVGLLLVALLPRLVHLLARADVAIARRLLAPDEATRLAARVTELQVSRDASVESSAGELRRIERDLHDGAQQRLVSLAMNLGMAKERLRESDDEHARELVGAAHDEAKQAIAELRDLVRGIHPAVLTDRGLDAAVSALVARCPVPVHLDTDLPRRLPQSLEATAYFVVAEALTNVAKHSRASTATVRLVERDQTLLVEVYDNGVGGADETAGGGLRGLRDRVAGVEGRLRIASPLGGPTVLSVELPCGS